MRKTKARELVRFGSNIRKLRETRDWTQEQLAEQAGLDQTYISGIERGERNATILTLAKLAGRAENDGQQGVRRGGGMTAPTFIDLFSGCGGFTLGLLRSGFECLAAVDSNAEAIATLRANLQAKVTTAAAHRLSAGGGLDGTPAGKSTCAVAGPAQPRCWYIPHYVEN